ncbi:leucine-rich repeat-containing protein 24-like [Scleropages formosus]|uniref:Leucine-rich repeat-containing protein 24-like n=2 Tax=Scleropages formosus TaxID=113540 RepID=A0A0P7TCK1_SCLFO|nr:leucine-rich repeat-containing protein 24-like [Scleropages formosus]
MGSSHVSVMSVSLLTLVLLPLWGLYAPPTLGCPSVCRCYSLTVECGSMGLREFPRNIPPITQTIFLQDNAIGQIRQQDLSQLPDLRYLYLQHNGLSALEPGAFRGQGQLLELALNGNRIHLVTPDVFQGLAHLRVLYLAGNQITRLQDFTFRGLQRLQELHLQENSVEVLGEQALAGLGSLALLDLSRNNLRTISQASLEPLVSLQVLRVTGNPWRCDCALHWLRTWIDEEGQRLLSSTDRRLVCAEPPRLSHLSLVEVPRNSLVCIPPAVRLQPRRRSVRPGESLRVSCQASGYPQPQVTWRKASQDRTQLSARGSAPDVAAVLPEPETTARTGAAADNQAEGERFDPDTGSGMLFLSNVTEAHAGLYECEAWNAGGVARVTFHLSVSASPSSSSSSSSSSVSVSSSPWRPWLHPAHPVLTDVSREPLYALGSMDFNALGAATQTAIAAGIALLALTALLLVVMIYSRHQQRQKGHQEESVLYVNDYSDGPTTFAQLEEYRDERGHEMYVLNRSRPVLPPAQQCVPPPVESPQHRAPQPLRRMAGEGEEAAPMTDVEQEELFLSQSLLFEKQIAYEIHC